jgi:hypothetical protein
MTRRASASFSRPLQEELPDIFQREVLPHLGHVDRAMRGERVPRGGRRLGVRAPRYCSPRHWVPCNSGVPPRERGYEAGTRRVRGFKLRVDDMAGNYAVFQGTSNGGRQFLRNTRSNRHIVPLYGKSDRLFTEGLKFETR